jgi:hypothetical protein
MSMSMSTMPPATAAAAAAAARASNDRKKGELGDTDKIATPPPRWFDFANVSPAGCPGRFGALAVINRGSSSRTTGSDDADESFLSDSMDIISEGGCEDTLWHAIIPLDMMSMSASPLWVL